MNEKQLLSEYLKEHHDEQKIEQKLSTGKLVAFGIPFDPDFHAGSPEQLGSGLIN